MKGRFWADVGRGYRSRPYDGLTDRPLRCREVLLMSPTEPRDPGAGPDVSRVAGGRVSDEGADLTFVYADPDLGDRWIFVQVKGSRAFSAEGISRADVQRLVGSRHTIPDELTRLLHGVERHGGRWTQLALPMANVSERDYRTLQAEAERQGRPLDDVVGEALGAYAANSRRRRALAKTRARVENEARREGVPTPGRALREYEEATNGRSADEYTEPGRVEDTQA